MFLTVVDLVPASNCVVQCGDETMISLGAISRSEMLTNRAPYARHHAGRLGCRRYIPCLAEDSEEVLALLGGVRERRTQRGELIALSMNERGDQLIEGQV